MSDPVENTTLIAPEAQASPSSFGKRPPLAESRGKGHTADTILHILTLGSAITVLLMMIALILVLGISALSSIRTYGVKFLTTSSWRPNAITVYKRDAKGHMLTDDGQVTFDADQAAVDHTDPPVFGALPVIFGTTLTSIIALVLAIPLSFGAALFLIRIGPGVKPVEAQAFLLGAALTVNVELLLSRIHFDADHSYWSAILGIAVGLIGFAISTGGVILARKIPRDEASTPKRIGSILTGILVACALFIGGAGFVFLLPIAAIAALAVYYIAESANACASFLIEFLAAIPSIAYGLWGIFVLGPFLQTYLEPSLNWVFHFRPLHWLYYGGQVTGRDMFAGGLILAIMILPIITAISRDVLKAVPRAQIEGTLALGATWWQSSREMLRYSRSGLFGAVMLGLARAAGETMAVTMVIGNVAQIKGSLFAAGQTMASLLANEFAESDPGLQRSALLEVALILLLMSLTFNVVARYLVVGKGARVAA